MKSGLSGCATNKPHTPQSFWSKMSVGGPDDCWLWNGTVDRGGYGQIEYQGRTWKASRLAWTLTHGAVPDGLFVLHNCDIRDAVGDRTNRRCCNPAHLWLGTAAENVHDCLLKGRTSAGERHFSRRTPERRPRGERHGMARLTAQRVTLMRQAHAICGVDARELAPYFHVDYTTVRKILTGKLWSHVP